MRVLLIGCKAETREWQSQLLRDSGYDAKGIDPSSAAAEMGTGETSCLVLGPTVPEGTATRLATQFQSSGTDRFIVRVADIPIGTTYPYASLVVNPNNPRALLAAVGAIQVRYSRISEETERVRRYWENRLSEICEALSDPKIDPEMRKSLEITGFEIKQLLRDKYPQTLKAG